MRRIAALVVLLVAARVASAQPITGGGLAKVSHSSAFTGNGTNPSPLDLTHGCPTSSGLVWNGTSWGCGSSGVTSITAGTGLSGGTITTSGTIALANTAVTAATYTYATVTFDAQGRATSASNGVTPALASTTISASTGLSGGGDLSTNRSFALANTAVSAGSYTYGSFTVDAQGRLTAASSGTAPAAVIASDFTGTNGVIPKRTGTTTYGDSSMTDSGSAISTSDGSFAVTPATAAVNLGDGSTSYLRYVATPSANFIESGTSSSSGHAATLSFTDINASNTWMTIGTTGAVSITSNTLDMGSHKITSVTDGSNPHDAVAFDQLAAAVAGGVSGAAPQTAIFGSTNSVTSGWASDNGSTWGVTSKFVINESTGATDIYGTLDLHGALVASAGATTVGNFAGTICSTTATGTQTDWAPSCLATASTIANTASTTLTINTLTGGVVGRRVRIKNLGTGEVIVKNNGSGTAGNKLLNDGTFDVELYAASYGATDCSADYEYYSDNNWHEVAFNCSTIGSLATGGGVQIQFNNNLTGVSQLQANNINVNASAFTVSSAGAVNTASTINATGFVQSSAEVFAGSLDVYLNTTNSGNIGFQDGVNATASGYINAVGYLEGTTQFRDLHIQNGKGVDALTIVGSTKAATFAASMTAGGGAYSVDASGNVTDTAPTVDYSGTTTVVMPSFAHGTYFDSNGLNEGYTTNATDTAYINYDGYSAGHSQLRNLCVSNGEGATQTGYPNNCPLYVTGSTGAVESQGLLTGDLGVAGVNSYRGTHREWNDEWNMVYTAIGTGLTGIPIGSTYSATLSGAGGTATQINGIAWTSGHVGGVSLGTGNAASGYVAITTGVTSVNFNSGNWTFAATVGWPTLSSSSASTPTRYVSEVGFFNQTTTPNQINGCYYAYDVGNFLTGGVNTSNTANLEAVCTSGSTSTFYLLNGTGTCDSSSTKGTVSIAAFTQPTTNAHRLSVVMTGDTSAAFYDGTTEVCMINTNIPTISTMSAGVGIWEEASSGTGNVLLDLDQTHLAIDSTSAPTPAGL